MFFVSHSVTATASNSRNSRMETRLFENPLLSFTVFLFFIACLLLLSFTLSGSGAVRSSRTGDPGVAIYFAMGAMSFLGSAAWFRKRKVI